MYAKVQCVCKDVQKFACLPSRHVSRLTMRAMPKSVKKMHVRVCMRGGGKGEGGVLS